MTIHDAFQTGIAVLADAYEDEANPAIVHGVAIPEDSVATGMAGEPMYYPGDVLRDAEGMLAGKPLVEGHPGVEKTEDGLRVDPQPPVSSVVGEVLEDAYKEGVGLVFKAELDDPDIAAVVRNQRAGVSPIVARDLGEPDPERGARPATSVEAFRDLGVVTEGALPGNSIATGSPESAAMAADALASVFETKTTAGGTAIDAYDVSIHRPTYSDTTEAAAGFTDGAWGRPALEDFEDDDLSAVAEHFLASQTGFPPESYGELQFPVVEPDGTLNLNGLQAARQRIPQAEGLAESERADLMTTTASLANDEFDEDWEGGRDALQAQLSDEPAESGRDSGSTSRYDIMTDDDLTDKQRELLAQASQADDPTVVEADAAARLDEADALLEAADSVDADIDAVTVVAEENYDALQQRTDAMEAMLDERLAEEVGLRSTAIDAMGFEAKVAQFEDDDGEFDVDAFVQTPETGDADGGDGAGSGELDEEDEARVDALRSEIEFWSGKDTMEGYVEEKREELAELTGGDA